MDKTNWNEKNGDTKQNMQAQISRLVQMCKESKKIMIAIVVFLLIIISVLAIITFSEKQEEVAAAAETETVNQEQIVVPEEALEKDAYPEVNNLVKQYYQALVDGDMDTIKSLKSHVDEEEELKIVKKSEFIENYPMITVYTKKGPAEGSFVAYVQYEVKFINQENTAPGLNTLYICMNEEGKYYINANELEESVVEYLKTISVQNDVVDLFNTVQVAYNDIKTQDENLSAFLDELPSLLAEAVSEAIIEQEAAEAALHPEEEKAEQEVVVVVTKVKTTDVVNVRSSDSIEADKLGRTSKGQVLELVEEKVNGWSKVIFEGKEGYIKTEFLEPEETEMQVTENAATSVDSASDDTFPKTGKLTDNVNVRKTASTEADIVDHLSRGSEIEVLEQMNNGWSKIKTNGKEVYVKSEFIKIEENVSENKNSEDKESQSSSTEVKKGKLTDNVNLRKEPSTEAKSLGIINRGTEVEIIEQLSSGWTKINYSTEIGYIKSDYVEVKE